MGSKRPLSGYATVAQTRALLAASKAFRNDRLGAGDMVSIDEAAAIAGASAATISRWIAQGRAIGLYQAEDDFRLPAWQFDPAIWKAVAQIATALGVTDGWTLLAFLESPHGGLDGKSPRVALERGRAARVVEIAKAEGL